MDDLLIKILKDNVESKLIPVLGNVIDEFFIPNDELEALEIEMDGSSIARICVRIAGERICFP